MASIPFSEVIAHLTQNGKEILALDSIEDLGIIEKLEAKLDIREARKARRELKKTGGIPWPKVKKELGL